MDKSTIQLIATYVMAGLVLLGAFVLIYDARGDAGQAWLAVGAVLGFVFRDSAAGQSAANVTKIAAALQPPDPAPPAAIPAPPVAPPPAPVTDAIPPDQG